jgi:uncharacterized protein YjiK
MFENAWKKLEGMAPDAMNSMFMNSRETKPIKKQKKRKNFVVEDVPPTTSSIVYII